LLQQVIGHFGEGNYLRRAATPWIGSRSQAAGRFPEYQLNIAKVT